jgi:hypothetical protein
MSMLDTLRENRAKLADQVEAKRAEHLKIVTEERALTADEETEFTNLRSRLTSIDSALVEEEAREAEALKQQEERDVKLGGDGKGDPGHGAPNIRVGFEADLVYSKSHPENSWYQDMLDVNYAGPRQLEALERMRRHQEQMEGIYRAGAAGKDEHGQRAHRAVASYVRENTRFNKEQRATSTGGSSMGDFAPTIYMLPEYAPFRTYGRTLIDNLKKYPMPDSGLVFAVPTITQPTQGVNQTNSATQGANENTTVSSRDMTATYQTGTLQTIVDNLNVSQQYLDRVGPGIEGDMIVHDDQQRQMNRLLNIYAWNALFASGVGVVPYTDTAFNAYKFKAACHQAKAAIRKTDGVVAYPTTFFGDADLWESIEGAYDGQNRPFVVPQGVAFNPIAVGDESNAPEGYTGFKFAGLPAFADEAMWVSWSGGAASSGGSGYHPAVIGAFDIASYWMEGAPVIRVLPQPGAASLTVLIQQYNYAAYVPIYLNAIQAIYGTGTTTSYLL